MQHVMYFLNIVESSVYKDKHFLGTRPKKYVDYLLSINKWRFY